MRLLAILFVVLIVALQWPLWIGKGSWLKVWQLENQVTEQHKVNEKLKSRNTALDAEVKDLKTGVDAIEERARNELGMIRSDEVFFQILDHSGVSSTPKPTSPVPHEPAVAPQNPDQPTQAKPVAKPAAQPPALQTAPPTTPARIAPTPEVLQPGVPAFVSKPMPVIAQPQKPATPLVPKPASPKEPQR